MYVDLKKHLVVGEITKPLDVRNIPLLSDRQLEELKTVQDKLDETYKTEILSIRLGNKLKDELQTLAQHAEMSATDLAYKLIESYVLQNRKDEADTEVNIHGEMHEIKLFND